MRADRAEVVIVGAGPAGLAAATELRRRGVGPVVVLERERAAGGIPRHAHHQGFGLRDLHRVLSGPRYARVLFERAHRAGVDVRLRTQATGWREDGALELTGPAGNGTIRADAVVLATGCRERPRSARLVPGHRPQGVLTTGMLQQLVYLEHERVGRRAVVVGAEHVSFSALLTLNHAGARAVAMVTEQQRHQSFAALRFGAAARFRVPVHTRTAVTSILGRRRVEAAELTDLDSGRTREIECDVVVFTADWIPDHELAVLAGAELDPGTRGPAVDPELRTSMAGVFAAGNVLHGAEAADVVALDGRHVAAGVTDHLAGAAWPHNRIAVTCEPPLHWIAPNAVVPDSNKPRGSARGRFLLRAHEQLWDVRVELIQDGCVRHQERLTRVMPGRSASLSTAWIRDINPTGGDVVARIVSARSPGDQRHR